MKRFLFLALVCAGIAGASVQALQGVLEQIITFGDAELPSFRAFQVSFLIDPASVDTVSGGNGFAFWSPSGEAYAYGGSQTNSMYGGFATAKVALVEDTDDGNFNNGEGVIEKKTEAETEDPDKAVVTLSCLDDCPFGQVEVEIRQKSHATVSMAFVRNGADHQQKFFLMEAIMKMIDGSVKRQSIQWLGATTTTTTAGISGSLQVGFDKKGFGAEADVSGSFSSSVDQDTDYARMISKSDVSASTTFILSCSGGVSEETVEFSHGFAWEISVVDDNSVGFSDKMTLGGEARTGNVVYLGRISVKRNCSGTINSDPGFVVYNGFSTPGSPTSPVDGSYGPQDWFKHLEENAAKKLPKNEKKEAKASAKTNKAQAKLNDKLQKAFIKTMGKIDKVLSKL